MCVCVWIGGCSEVAAQIQLSKPKARKAPELQVAFVRLLWVGGWVVRWVDGGIGRWAFDFVGWLDREFKSRAEHWSHAVEVRWGAGEDVRFVLAMPKC